MGRNDVELMREHNVNAFLVGEAFMRANDPGEGLKALFFWNPLNNLDHT